ncbi:hypothetical protein HDU98_011878 [Podochytrium sp. JEL0797]|nr:hypothetical protein HDU98_011878 [Podochytrium sp. JEL0797]
MDPLSEGCPSASTSLRLLTNEPESIIKNKLAVDMRPIKRLVKRFQVLHKSIETKQDETTCTQALAAFLTDLSTFHTTVLSKQLLLQSMNDRQQAHFATDLESVLAQIDDTTADIARLKQQLEEEEVWRRQQVEYDQVARRVLELPSREETERNMTTLQLEIEALQSQQQALDESFEHRKTLLHNVVSAIHTMKDAIDASAITNGTDEAGSVDGSVEVDVEGDGERRRGGGGSGGMEEEEEEEGAFVEDKMDMS